MRKRNVQAVAIAAFTFIFLFGAVGAWADGDPVTAFKGLGLAAQAQDWGKFWDGCEESTQQTLGKLFLTIMAFASIDDDDLRARLEKEFGPPPKDAKNPNITRDQFIALMKLMNEMAEKEGDNPSDFFKSTEVKEREREQDKAVLEVKAEGKPMEEVIMLLRGGNWKFFMPDPFEEAGADAGGEGNAETAPAAGEDTDKAKKYLKKYFD